MGQMGWTVDLARFGGQCEQETNIWMVWEGLSPYSKGNQLAAIELY